MKTEKKKISTILPSDLLEEAIRCTNANQTDTLVFALQELIRAHKRGTLANLKGNLKIAFRAEKDRERSRF